ncbi:MAG TPA: hypothetical protein VK466_05955, partial [Terriglobales bacterium]|nr:hypothetical protein [Terriglobales bacterium]
HRHRLVQMRTRVMNQLHVVALNEAEALRGDADASIPGEHVGQLSCERWPRMLSAIRATAYDRIAIRLSQPIAGYLISQNCRCRMMFRKGFKGISGPPGIVRWFA